ncbi:MAG: response regulator transcription factor [Crocinitomicaceae bacterium]|nr:response regulator transcription factor [Crocinitomicaceae bacterium]
MSKLNLLIAEDDVNLGKLLNTFLTAKGFQTTLCENGEIAFNTFRKGDFDFLILDVMMPVKDGFTVAKEIREFDKEIPILFLTAKSMKEDKLSGFASGADDYLTKPFEMEELLARINAILRRAKGDADKEEKNQYEIGKIKYDASLQTIELDGESTRLTTKENMLFHLLVKNKNEVLDRNAALKAVWGDDNYFNGRSMDVYIAKLRKIIKSDESLQIVNVHGQGFKLIAQ